jgi:phage shock protein C
MKAEANYQEKKLYRSKTNRMLAGVCGGISEYLDLDAKLVRLIMLAAAFIGGIGLILYIAAVLLVPNNPEQEQVKAHEFSFDNKSIILGFVLVAVGFFLIFKGFPLIKIWYFFWQYAWGLFLILGGIFILFYKKENDTFFNLNLYRSSANKMLGGVCSGMAERFQIDISIVRILWILGTAITAGVGVLLYIICMILLPEKSEQPKPME